MGKSRVQMLSYARDKGVIKATGLGIQSGLDVMVPGVPSEEPVGRLGPGSLLSLHKAAGINPLSCILGT